MTAQEFSSQFDTLYNSLNSNKLPALDDYEKSVFLTQSQYDILNAYFNKRGNIYAEGFDDSKEKQIDFSKLIEVKSYDLTTTSTTSNVEVLTEKSLSFSKATTKRIIYPEDMIAIVNEKALDSSSSSNTYAVVPITCEEYDRLSSKPFKKPLKNQAWRLIVESGKGEVIPTSGVSLSSYVVRYVKRPGPIIVQNLPGDLKIEGESTQKTSSVDPLLHEEILQRAVELALAAYTEDLESSLVLGQTSSTQLGIPKQVNE